MRLPRKAKSMAFIPTASTADIAFLLIIYFMVTTTISKDKTVVSLPRSTFRTTLPTTLTIITIKDDNSIKIDGEPATMLDVIPVVSEQIYKNSEKEFILKIDKHVKYQIVDDLLEQLRQAKVKNISFATDQEREGEAPL